MTLILVLFMALKSLFFDPLATAKELLEKRHHLNVSPTKQAFLEVEKLQQKLRSYAGLVEEPQENYVFKKDFLDKLRYSFVYFPARTSRGENKFQENPLSKEEQKQLVQLSARAKTSSLVSFNTPTPNGHDLILEKSGEWTVTKGLCSASALTFAHHLLELLGNDLNCSAEEFIVGAALATSEVKDGENQELAILQGAMNTITRQNGTVDPLSPVFIHAKAEALAAFLKLDATPAGMPMIKPAIVPVAQLDVYLKQLEPGVYFFRSIVEENNAKGEEMGHSQVFVKTDSLYLFFDPNVGSVILQPEDNIASFIHYMWNFYLPATGLKPETIGQFYKLSI